MNLLPSSAFGLSVRNRLRMAWAASAGSPGPSRAPATGSSPDRLVSFFSMVRRFPLLQTGAAAGMSSAIFGGTVLAEYLFPSLEAAAPRVIPFVSQNWQAGLGAVFAVPVLRAASSLTRGLVEYAKELWRPHMLPYAEAEASRKKALLSNSLLDRVDRDWFGDLAARYGWIGGTALLLRSMTSLYATSAMALFSGTFRPVGSVVVESAALGLSIALLAHRGRQFDRVRSFLGDTVPNIEALDYLEAQAMRLHSRGFPEQVPDSMAFRVNRDAQYATGVKPERSYLFWPRYFAMTLGAIVDTVRRLVRIEGLGRTIQEYRKTNRKNVPAIETIAERGGPEFQKIGDMSRSVWAQRFLRIIGASFKTEGTALLDQVPAGDPRLVVTIGHSGGLLDNVMGFLAFVGGRQLAGFDVFHDDVAKYALALILDKVGWIYANRKGALGGIVGSLMSLLKNNIYALVHAQGTRTARAWDDQKNLARVSLFGSVPDNRHFDRYAKTGFAERAIDMANQINRERREGGTWTEDRPCHLFFAMLEGNYDASQKEAKMILNPERMTSGANLKMRIFEKMEVYPQPDITGSSPVVVKLLHRLVRGSLREMKLVPYLQGEVTRWSSVGGAPKAPDVFRGLAAAYMDEEMDSEWAIAVADRLRCIPNGLEERMVLREEFLDVLSNKTGQPREDALRSIFKRAGKAIYNNQYVRSPFGGLVREVIRLRNLSGIFVAYPLKAVARRIVMPFRKTPNPFREISSAPIEQRHTSRKAA